VLNIEIIEGCGSEKQYEYLLKCNKTLIYSTPRFINSVKKHLNAKAGWYIAKNEREIVGALPYLAKKGSLGPVYNSLAYFRSNEGVHQHIPDEQVIKALIKIFYDEAQNNKACSATIITNPLENDSLFYDQNAVYDYKDERIGQITHLTDIKTDEELLNKLEDPRPRNIRKAIKEGVSVEKSNSELDMEFLYETHKKNMLSIGGIPKELKFFKEIQQTMKKKEWAIFIAKKGEIKIGALLILYFNKTVEYFTPVIVEEYRNLQPLALIVFKAMQDAIELKYNNWNWGGTWVTQKGVYDFKKKWNTIDYPYFYYTKIYNSNVYNLEIEKIINEYPGCFVIPFKYLNKV